MERVLLMRCGSPMGGWKIVYASGDQDPELFEESLMISMQKYNPTKIAVWQRFDCNNSLQVKQLFEQKLHNEPRTELNGSWFSNINIDQIRIKIKEAIAEVGI